MGGLHIEGLTDITDWILKTDPVIQPDQTCITSNQTWVAHLTQLEPVHLVDV